MNQRLTQQEVLLNREQFAGYWICACFLDDCEENTRVSARQGFIMFVYVRKCNECMYTTNCCKQLRLIYSQHPSKQLRFMYLPHPKRVFVHVFCFVF